MRYINKKKDICNIWSTNFHFCYSITIGLFLYCVVETYCLQIITYAFMQSGFAMSIFFYILSSFFCFLL